MWDTLQLTLGLSFLLYVFHKAYNLLPSIEPDNCRHSSLLLKALQIVSVPLAQRMVWKRSHNLNVSKSKTRDYMYVYCWAWHPQVQKCSTTWKSTQMAFSMNKGNCSCVTLLYSDFVRQIQQGQSFNGKLSCSSGMTSLDVDNKHIDWLPLILFSCLDTPD